MEEKITQSDIDMLKAVIREMQCDLEEQQEILNKLETGIRLKRDNKRRLEVILDSFLDGEELVKQLKKRNQDNVSQLQKMLSDTKVYRGGIMMKNNTTELLSMIVKAMSEEGIELTNVKLYEQAVELNNEVKVSISIGGYIVRKINERGAISCTFEKSMVNKVLEIFKESEWLPGDDIEAYGEWFTLVVEESSYYAEKNQYQVYRLLDENYSLSERMTLEDLKRNYTNVSLEQGRLK